MKKLLLLAIVAVSCFPGKLVLAAEADKLSRELALICNDYKKVVDEALAMPVKTTDAQILEKKFAEYNAARERLRSAIVGVSMGSKAAKMLQECIKYNEKNAGDWDLDVTIKIREARSARRAPYVSAVDEFLKLDLTTASIEELTSKRSVVDKALARLSPSDKEAVKEYKSCDLDCYHAIVNQFNSANIVATERGLTAVLGMTNLGKEELKNALQIARDPFQDKLKLIARHFSTCKKPMPVLGFLKRYNALIGDLERKIKPIEALKAVESSDMKILREDLESLKISADSLVKHFSEPAPRTRTLTAINAGKLADNIKQNIEFYKKKFVTLRETLRVNDSNFFDVSAFNRWMLGWGKGMDALEKEYRAMAS